MFPRSDIQISGVFTDVITSDELRDQHLAAAYRNYQLALEEIAKKPALRRLSLQKIWQLLHQSAAEGCLEARHKIGDIYAKGLYGIAVSMPLARRHYRMAAEKEHYPSKRALQNMDVFEITVRSAIMHSNLKKLSECMRENRYETKRLIRENSDTYLRCFVLSENIKLAVYLFKNGARLAVKPTDPADDYLIFRFVSSLVCASNKKAKNTLFNLVKKFGLKELRRTRKRDGMTALEILEIRDKPRATEAKQALEKMEKINHSDSVIRHRNRPKISNYGLSVFEDRKERMRKELTQSLLPNSPSNS